MQCREFKARWQSALDARAPCADRPMAEHLDGCPACRSLVAAWSAIEAALSEPTGPLDSLLPAPPPEHPARSRRLAALLSVAAALAVAVTLRTRPSTAPSERAMPLMVAAISQSVPDELPGPADPAALSASGSALDGLIVVPAAGEAEDEAAFDLARDTSRGLTAVITALPRVDLNPVWDVAYSAGHEVLGRPSQMMSPAGMSPWMPLDPLTTSISEALQAVIGVLPEPSTASGSRTL